MTRKNPGKKLKHITELHSNYASQRQMNYRDRRTIAVASRNARAGLDSSCTKCPSTYFGHSLTTNFCNHCNKDTPHKTFICIYCNGIAIAPKRVFVNRRGWSFGITRYYGDKKRAYHQRAEESRKKFEGS
jgi:hypothetical protein